VLAKILESSDGVIFSCGHIISGHTLKHGSRRRGLLDFTNALKACPTSALEPRT
jgi:hypothetical protein